MTKQLQSIQALRGIACLSVMAFHYRWMIDESFPGLGQLLFSWGEVGVDLFFILSGFVITLSVSRLGTGVGAAADFLKRRALRLLPAYYILLVINFAFGGAMATFHYADKVQALIGALTLSVYWPHHAPFYIDDNGFMNVRWTLNYEFLFYLMMGACLLVRARWLALAVMLVVTLVAVPLLFNQPLTLSIAGYGFEHAYINLMTNPIIWQFAAGVLIGLVYPHMVRLPLLIRVASLIAAVILLVKHLTDGAYVGHGMMASGTVLALLLAAVAFNDSWLGRITPRWLALVGDISFSVYLLHIVTERVVSKRIPVEGIWLFITASAASLLVGWLSWRYIEPVGQKIAQRRRESKALKQQSISE